MTLNDVINSESQKAYQDMFTFIIGVSSEKMVNIASTKQKLDPQTYIDDLYGNI